MPRGAPPFDLRANRLREEVEIGVHDEGRGNARVSLADLLQLPDKAVGRDILIRQDQLPVVAGGDDAPKQRPEDPEVLWIAQNGDAPIGGGIFLKQLKCRSRRCVVNEQDLDIQARDLTERREGLRENLVAIVGRNDDREHVGWLSIWRRDFRSSSFPSVRERICTR